MRTPSHGSNIVDPWATQVWAAWVHLYTDFSVFRLASSLTLLDRMSIGYGFLVLTIQSYILWPCFSSCFPSGSFRSDFLSKWYLVYVYNKWNDIGTFVEKIHWNKTGLKILNIVNIFKGILNLEFYLGIIFIFLESDFVWTIFQMSLS